MKRTKKEEKQEEKKEKINVIVASCSCGIVKTFSQFEKNDAIRFAGGHELTHRFKRTQNEPTRPQLSGIVLPPTELK